MSGDSPADHVFNRKSAPPALQKAMEDLSQRSGRSIDDMDQMTMREAYQLALQVYGDDLPDFWNVWGDWARSADEPPRPMGDL